MPPTRYRACSSRRRSIEVRKFCFSNEYFFLTEDTYVRHTNKINKQMSVVYI